MSPSWRRRALENGLRLSEIAPIPLTCSIGSRTMSPAGDEITASALTSVGQNKVIGNSRASVKPPRIG
jgi:hypothetical protein